MSPSAVKTANQAAVTAAYNALRGFESVPHNWNGSASRCQAGADSQANRDATIAAINTYRAMAGLDPLREDKALSSRAAYAALIMEANNRVTHYPAKNSACWTQTGYTESGRSNLTLGAHGAAAVSALMTDTGPTNEATVGHRSWLLKPRLGSVGTASSARTNAISVQGGATNQKAANPAAIPWPSAGYFPWQWVRPYMSWSVSSAGADFSAARVTVTKNGQPISASRYPSGPTKGVETLVWSMSDVTQPAPGVTDSYEVKVTGVRQAAAGSFSYSVKIYWVPEIEINESLNYNILPSGSQLATGRSILSSYIGLKPAQAKATRQWLADGVPIAGATGVTLLLTDRLQCLPIGIRYSATYPGAATVSRTWNSIASWEGCPAPTGLRLPSAGTIKAPFASLSLLPDVNGNGLGEIIALDQASKLVLYPLTTTTSLGQPGRLGYGFTGHRLYSPGDWNRDGWPDIMTITPDNLLWLYPGATGGRIGSGRQIGNGWGGYQLVPSGDVTGDGVPDLLAVDSTGYLWIYPNDGRGGFRSRVKAGHGWSGLRLYAAGDADRNGTNDIFMLNPAGDLYFYGGYGNAVFATKRKVGNGWTGFELLSGTDLTGDGMADIVGRSTEGNLYLYRGTGGGAFAKKIQVGRGW
jgi:uncharacterized protein YkwD